MLGNTVVMVGYCAVNKSQLIRLLYMQIYSKSRSGSKWVKGALNWKYVLWPLIHLHLSLCFWDFSNAYRFYDVVLYVSWKGFISCDCMECGKSSINLIVIIIIPLMIPLKSTSAWSSTHVAPPNHHHPWSAPVATNFRLVWLLMTADGVTPFFYNSNTSFLSLILTPLPHLSYQYYVKSELYTSCDQITLTKSDKAACKHCCKPLVIVFCKNASKALCNIFSLLRSSQSPLTPRLSKVNPSKHWHNACTLYTCSLLIFCNSYCKQWVEK